MAASGKGIRPSKTIAGGGRARVRGAIRHAALLRGTKSSAAPCDFMSEPPDLEEEMERLVERLPDGAARVVRKVRAPEAAPYRIPAGVVLTVGGVLGFMPILGFWMVPLGLAVMAQDVPI